MWHGAVLPYWCNNLTKIITYFSLRAKTKLSLSDNSMWHGAALPYWFKNLTKSSHIAVSRQKHNFHFLIIQCGMGLSFAIDKSMFTF